MAIETSKFKKHKLSSYKKRSNFGLFKTLIVILVIIPIVFMFTDSSARAAFFSFQTAKIYESLKKYPEAKKYYSIAYESSGKKHTLAQLKFADMCNKMEQYNEALTVTNGMLEFGTSDELLLAEVWYQNGKAWEGLGGVDEALVSYLKAQKLKPDHYPALIGLGTTFRMKGDYPKSREYLESAIGTRRLRAPEAHYELGLTYLAENNNADALDEFEMVIRQMGNRELKQKANEEKIKIISNRQ